jgi:hypothetical protein
MHQASHGDGKPNGHCHPNGKCRTNGRRRSASHSRSSSASMQQSTARRNRGLHLGLALLVAACCLRLTAEAWRHTSGTGNTHAALFSAFTARRTEHPWIDSATLFSNATPPAPIDSVLTSEVIYGTFFGPCRVLLLCCCIYPSRRNAHHSLRSAAGFLRLQYGRESIPNVDLRARAALEFPGVRPVHSTNTSAFNRLLVASLQPGLQVPGTD